MKLLDYIKGNRRGKEAHRLEHEAMDDPFLSEALDGFDSVEGNHPETLERLRRRVAERAAPRGRKRLLWIVGSAAALLLLFLTIGNEFLFRDKPAENIVPYLSEATPTLPASPDTSELRKQQPLEIAQSLEEREPSSPEVITEQLSITPLGNTVSEDKTGRLLFDLAEEDVDLAIAPVPQAAAPVDSPRERSTTGNALGALSGKVSGVRIKDNAPASSRLASNLVTGRVTDPAGEPLIGVTVAVEGTRKGVVTDTDGQFYMQDVPPGATLTASYLGYESVSVPAGSSPQQIVMPESTSQLDEIVVIGYGTQTRRDVTGSVSVVRDVHYLPLGEPQEGMEAFRKYLDENRSIIVDEDGREVSGRVELEFRVNRNGRPAGISVIESLSDKADKEAIRLLKNGPDWKPAQGRVKVRIDF